MPRMRSSDFRSVRKVRRLVRPDPPAPATALTTPWVYFSMEARASLSRPWTCAA